MLTHVHHTHTHTHTEDLDGSDLRISGVQRFSIYDALFISNVAAANNWHPPRWRVKEHTLVPPLPLPVASLSPAAGQRLKVKRCSGGGVTFSLRQRQKVVITVKSFHAPGCVSSTTAAAAAAMHSRTRARRPCVSTLRPCARMCDSLPPGSPLLCMRTSRTDEDHYCLIH